MRVVGIAIITALLSAGCAIQAGEPTPEETSQRPNELVGLVGGDQPGVNARPQVQTHTAIGQTGPNDDSPNPSPWTEGTSDPSSGGGGPNGVPPGGGMGGNGGNQDNPNPSPWTNSATGGRMGTGGSGSGTGN
jgi:hypothetical protein